MIFYRLYVLGQPDEEIRDFQAIFAISLFGHMITQLFLGGLLPVPTWRGMVAGYLVLAGVIVTVCLAIYGMPEAADWHNTWLPTLVGPVIFLGLYRLVAWLGRRRIEAFITAGKIVGAELLVVHHDRTVRHRGFGWRDVDAGTPMEPGTIFNLRSMAKPILGSIAERLVD